MLILGIESSCDDTTAAVVEDGKKVLSNIIASQHDIHAKYGGIVPELASRRHIENIPVVIAEALQNANIEMKDIDAVAVTYGPGLLGALLVGMSTAKGIAWAEKKPLIPVHHIHGHIVAAELTQEIKYPNLTLVVSGGHTSLFRVDSPTKTEELSSTRDDAAGEAFDKVAKMLGLGFPGGPAIEKLAGAGNKNRLNFKVPSVKGDPLAFSFSGLKTAVRLAMSKSPDPGDLSAAFQSTVVKSLVTKTMLAAEKYGFGEVVIAGGVACNNSLRNGMAEAGKKIGIEVKWPEPVYCTDNGAMIAAAGYHLYMDNPKSPLFNDFLALDAVANLKL
jgi:N6-L-threonylcarbamoyladenine synthase